MNSTKNNLKSINANQSNFGSNNYPFYNNHGNIDNFPNINAVSNQYIRNSVLKAYQTHNYFNVDDNNNNNTIYLNDKSKNHIFKTVKKEEGISFYLFTLYINKDYPVIDTNVQFFNSKGFYTNTNFNRKIEFTRLAQAMNCTNSNFYDSTFYDTAKSKFSKQSEFSFSPKNVSTVIKAKPIIDINNTRDINESMYGSTNFNFRNTHDNKIDRTRFLSQEINNTNKFDDNLTAKNNKKKKNENKKREVTYSLAGNVKINTLMSPKKFYKDYYIKYITKGINNDKLSEDKIFERKYIEDDDYNKKMNFYSQDLDYNLIDRNIKITKTNKTEFPAFQKYENDENMSKRLYQEAKNIYKTKMPKYNSRTIKFKKNIEDRSKTKGVEFQKQIDRSQNFSYLNEFLRTSANCEQNKKNLSEDLISLDVIRYLNKINKDLVNKYDNGSIYKNINMCKENVEIPKDDEIYDILKKLCIKPQYVENQ